MSAQHHTVGLGRAVRGRETRQVSDPFFLASVNKDTPRVSPVQSAVKETVPCSEPPLAFPRRELLAFSLLYILPA